MGNPSRHLEERISLGLVAKHAATIRNIRSGFARLVTAPLREIMSSLPTVTSGATTSMAGTPRYIPFGYGSPQSLFSLSGFHSNITSTDAVPAGDNTTTDFALTTYTASTKRISFIHTGQFVEFQFSPSTTTTFSLKVDGKYESLTPVSETSLYRKYDFGSSATRRIDFIAAGPDVSSFQPRGVWIGATDTIIKAPIRGPRCILVGDSFGSSPRAFPNAFAEALGWDDVWGSGIGGTGYVATSGGASPTFGMRAAHDVIAFNPQVVGIVGSVNDNSSSYSAVYNAALALYQALQNGLPNALIFASHTASSGAGGEAANSLRNRAAKKAAAAAAGILWCDVTEQPTQGPLLTGTVQFNATLAANNLTLSTTWASNESQGLVGSTLRFGDEAAGTGERQLVISRQQSGEYTLVNFAGVLAIAHLAGAPFAVVGGSYLSGVGRVGATTGVGNADLLVSNDAVHPSDAGQDALGVALASTLFNAINNLYL